MLARNELITGGEDEDSRGQPDIDEALAAVGLYAESREGIDPEPFYLLPELVPALGLWFEVQTQWRLGGLGDRTGLDYCSVWAHIERLRGLGRPRRRRELFEQLQVMERAALAAWAEQRESR